MVKLGLGSTYQLTLVLDLEKNLQKEIAIPSHSKDATH